MKSVEIRPEAAPDHLAVRTILEAAFGQAEEAALVDLLRREPGTISLVAARANEVLGHLLLSQVRLGDARPLALAPMAVRPDHQREGIGGALVLAALDAARASGAPAVIVLGHPEYYPRFGFVPAAPHGLRCKWPVPAEAYLVHELEAGWLERTGGGEVVYSAAFDGVA